MDPQIPKKLIDVFEDEVQNRVRGACVEFAERVCRAYGLNKMDVMAMIPDVRTLSGESKCKGITQMGAVCTRTGQFDGYCKLHLYQREQSRPVPFMQRNYSEDHNPDMCLGYVPGCPACEKDTRDGYKDLDDILG